MGRKDDIKPRKTDRRTIYTRNVIKDALLEAMKEKSFEQITVTDVCRRAEVTRATYYLHYQSLNQVLDELLNDPADSRSRLPKTRGRRSADSESSCRRAGRSFKRKRISSPCLPPCCTASEIPGHFPG